MVRKVLMVIMIVLMPSLALAQEAGEHVIRPVKKQETSSTPAKKKQKSKNSGGSQTASAKPTTQRLAKSKSSAESIIKRLISNMVYVEGGTFMMGATSEQGNDAYDNEKPAHRVTVSSFSIGKYEVTQEEWEAVMGSGSIPYKDRGEMLPVESFSWNECQSFIQKLNSITGKNFRMPTEAEWEFAARGGNKSMGYKYSGSNTLSDVGWTPESPGKAGRRAVGLLDPNELGLYDMSGNLSEWCSDWYGSYESGTQMNPSGPSSGSERVIRGGCFALPDGHWRVSARDYYYPDERISDTGLRLAL